MQFPLGEMLGALREFKQVLPQIKAMPDKLFRIDSDLLKLTSSIEKEYLTVNEYKMLNTYQSSDLKTIIDNVATQTINKVETIIETRIPFQKINDLAGMQGAVQGFRTAEKRMMKVFSELESIKQSIEVLDKEDRKLEALLFGISRD
jgi:hypothetical protein